MASCHSTVYKYFCASPNKSVLYWTQVCKLLHYSTQEKNQLHETTLQQMSIWSGVENMDDITQMLTRG
jgi:hypothetical protein